MLPSHRIRGKPEDLINGSSARISGLGANFGVVQLRAKLIMKLIYKLNFCVLARESCKLIKRGNLLLLVATSPRRRNHLTQNSQALKLHWKMQKGKFPMFSGWGLEAFAAALASLSAGRLFRLMYRRKIFCLGSIQNRWLQIRVRIFLIWCIWEGRGLKTISSP